MDASASRPLFLLLLSVLFVCSSGSFDAFMSGLKDIMHKGLKNAEVQTMHSYRRELIQTIQHDFMNPPITTFPTPTPLTNPVTTPNPVTAIPPPDTSTPPLVTAPFANPVTATPNPPVTVPPFTDPNNPPIPVTNPVTTPSTTIPGAPSMGNPMTTPVNAPAVPGQSWCVARGGLPDTSLQVALDYACGIGGADCSAIQQGASCYNPNTMQNHASYAFNSYYQKNPGPTSCDFGGNAMITNVNPSSGSCVFTTMASSSGSPTMTSPLTTPIPTPTMGSSSGATPAGIGSPPNILGASNPPLGGGITGYGENPPTASISSASIVQPLIGCIIMGISIITGRTVLGI